MHHLTRFHSASVDPDGFCVRAGSFTEEENAGMMDSLRSATRNTGFDRWLESTLGDGRAGSSPLPATVGSPLPATAADTSVAGSKAAAHSIPPGGSVRADSVAGRLNLQSPTGVAQGAADLSHTALRQAHTALVAGGTAKDGVPVWGEDTAAVAGLRADIPSPSPPPLVCIGGGGGDGGGDRQTAPLDAVARYLASAPAAAVPGAAPPPSQSLVGAFRPGWEVRTPTYLTLYHISEFI